MYASTENENDSLKESMMNPLRTITVVPAPGCEAGSCIDVGLIRLFRNIRRNTVDFLIATDSRGIIRLTSFNTGLLLGCNQSELQGIDIRSLFDNDKGRTSDIMADLEAEEELENLEMILKRKDGNTLHVNISASLLIGEDRQRLGSFFLLRDISEKKKMEDQLRHAQKMEAIGTLAGGIAHDFNNLLTGIQGYASLMLFDVQPQHPHYEMLKSIEQQIQSGADLTKKLLGFAKGGKYEVRPIDINDLVRKSAKIFGRTRKEIKMHGSYADPLRTAEVDASQIEHVLLNLYINAWQAMPEGGDLHIETENVMLDEPFLKTYRMKPGPFVKVSVTDNGVGMDAETQSRVFEPFFTTKERGRGTGLGLASAYGIVKSHGGVIKVYSEIGKGTTVTIYLPASNKGKFREIKPRRQIRRGHETILIIDDEESNARVTGELLERVGYRVLTANNGMEGAAIFKKRKEEISLVILDMIMPGMTGKETFEVLKEIEPAVRVILSSGYSLNGQAREIMEQGCRGFIQKPFDIMRLSEKIGEVLQETRGETVKLPAHRAEIPGKEAVCF
jgi:two-component system cell cycle sensor histidine kinase/response regulator CckA